MNSIFLLKPETLVNDLFCSAMTCKVTLIYDKELILPQHGQSMKAEKITSFCWPASNWAAGLSPLKMRNSSLIATCFEDVIVKFRLSMS